ncbi:hypothetical protein GRI38_07740 [Altererythrobacter aurantiacus]|uniref:DUF4062 domain-containing protein n=1 Tax=Parapontixanthobacter aurantiacus TaxID=1463599 RepID=A0A844ZF59_9SPHN|nr:DUF4062 domain-containing protein [Parapontixanthobacter aurantiacus]MXO85923.1 hypothetical protein [Parapontixanthobacter aurantiacus]
MTYVAQIIEVMIASPSDVADEREAIRQSLSHWNAANARERQLFFEAVGWESHVSPDLSGEPQKLINEQILRDADLLVGLFWTRIGTPTSTNASGTVEEIEEHMATGKPVMLYFSSREIAPNAIDMEQKSKLDEFRNWAFTRGIVESFSSIPDLKEKFSRQLGIALNKNSHLQSLIPGTDNRLIINSENSEVPSRGLSDEASALLKAASQHERNPMILIRRHLGGQSLSAGGTNFGDEGGRRQFERWIAAVEELHYADLIRDINGKGEIYEINHAGYELAESL